MNLINRLLGDGALPAHEVLSEDNSTQLICVAETTDEDSYFLLLSKGFDELERPFVAEFGPTGIIRTFLYANLDEAEFQRNSFGLFKKKSEKEQKRVTSKLYHKINDMDFPKWDKRKRIFHWTNEKISRWFQEYNKLFKGDIVPDMNDTSVVLKFMDGCRYHCAPFCPYSMSENVRLKSEDEIRKNISYVTNIVRFFHPSTGLFNEVIALGYDMLEFERSRLESKHDVPNPLELMIGLLNNFPGARGTSLEKINAFNSAQNIHWLRENHPNPEDYFRKFYSFFNRAIIGIESLGKYSHLVRKPVSDELKLESIHYILGFQELQKLKLTYLVGFGKELEGIPIRDFLSPTIEQLITLNNQYNSSTFEDRIVFEASIYVPNIGTGSYKITPFDSPEELEKQIAWIKKQFKDAGISSYFTRFDYRESLPDRQIF